MDNIFMPEGNPVRKHETAEYTKSLEGLEYAMQNGIILEATAVLCDASHNLHIDLGGCKGIIPREETVYSPSGEPVKDIAIITRVGKSVCFVVDKIDTSGEEVKIILSRKKAQQICCDYYVSRFENGDVIDVTVTHLERFGVFCDIGCGMIGLLPIDCISVSRISHPSERFVCGQTIKCVVGNIDREICRVTLTHKELLGTWEENAAMFSAGETACGIVRSVEPYGIFVELAPNLAGLAEWCDGVSEGNVAAVYIKSIIPEKMKIKLVIVNVSSQNPRENTVSEEYFFEGNHMDFWRYSPKSSEREIYTSFN